MADKLERSVAQMDECLMGDVLPVMRKFIFGRRDGVRQQLQNVLGRNPMFSGSISSLWTGGRLSPTQSCKLARAVRCIADQRAELVGVDVNGGFKIADDVPQGPSPLADCPLGTW